MKEDFDDYKRSDERETSLEPAAFSLGSASWQTTN
jgi:hypothetical protein